MYGISGFAEKLNIMKSINSTGNYVHYMYRMFGFADKMKIKNNVNSPLLCTLNVRKVWFCGEIEYPKFRKFNEKLCTLYMFGMSGYAEKLKI